MKLQEFISCNEESVILKRYKVKNVIKRDVSLKCGLFELEDGLLQISCYGFVTENPALSGIGENIRSLLGEDVVILSAGHLEDGYMLVFSKGDAVISDISFQQILEAEESDDLEIQQSFSSNNHFSKTLGENTIIREQYKIIDCIGIGGFGITYLCEDMLLKRVVALKEYYPSEWVEREDAYVMVKDSRLLQAFHYGMKSFQNEIQMTAKFIHTPHIVTVFDEVEANDTIYMVMEFIPGISIGREMKQRNYKPFSEYELADIMFPIMDALEAMHRQGMVHSDISPGNMIHSGNDQYYLIDLGAAKYNGDKRVQMSAAFLKVDYAAPEQYRTARSGIPDGEGPWTDIYALGATIYYLLTGKKPTDVISRLDGTNTDIRDSLIGILPVSWIDLIGKAMELEKDRRFASIADLRKQMLCIL